jgi:maltose alpha-D-glucosyltransferase/alpha-amylase
MDSLQHAADAMTPEPFEATAFSALLSTALPSEVQRLLSEHIRTRRWFRGKAREIRRLEVLDSVPLRTAPRELALVILRVEYAANESETYVLALGFDPATELGGSADGIRLFDLALTQGERRSGTVYDPAGSDELSQALLEMFVQAETRGLNGRILARPSEALKARVGPGKPKLAPRVPSGEQSNTTVFFGHEFMLKLFRQLEAGDNPDVEVNEMLWATGYRHVPEPLGSASYERDGLASTLGIIQRFVPSEGIAWEVTLEILQRSLELARELESQQVEPSLPSADLVESMQQSPPHDIEGFLSAFTPFATLLGERTAELHVTLAANSGLPAFEPEPFTAEYQRSIVQAARDRLTRAFDLLGEQLTKLPADVQQVAKEVLGCRDGLAKKLDELDGLRVNASRIRCHGDYHLGQVLYGENDFTILDFEGEPAQPLELRRSKRSALYDVCGMLRSFHYAATVALQDERNDGTNRATLSRWTEAWYRWTSAVFLCAYAKKARESGRAMFLPRDPSEVRALLRLHLIDKCSYELSYELNNRPDWVGVPLAGLLNLARGI